MLDSLVVLRSSTWLVDTPSLPHGGAEAEDRHSNFYDTWVNLPSAASRVSAIADSVPLRELPGFDPDVHAGALFKLHAEGPRLRSPLGYLVACG
jgi:hypothetical protein